MNEVSELIKWSATTAIAISGMLVSFNIRWSTIWWPFIGFLVGHIIWSVAAFIMKEWALFALNIVFVLIDIYAITIRINNKTGENNATSSSNEVSVG